MGGEREMGPVGFKINFQTVTWSLNVGTSY